MENTIKIEYTTGYDDVLDKHYIDIKENRDIWVRRYYEQIDQTILQNMPQEILESLYELSCKEIKRRQNV